MMALRKAVIMADNVDFYDSSILDYVYGEERLAHLKTITDMYPIRINSANLAEELQNLSEIEVIFTTWGMLNLTSQQIEQMPKLKAVFCASGSVNYFAKEFFKRGILIINAVEANAIPVAEFCLAQILLSCKNFYQNSRQCEKGPWQQSQMTVGNGVYGETIALIGLGAVSKHLIKLLKPFNLKIIACCDYHDNSTEEAKKIGIDEFVTLEQAFSRAYVVSNHLADKENNKKIISKFLFNSMRQGATFINTGRGAQVNEEDMIDVFETRKDLTALLDVQYPEPPALGNPLYTLENIYMTSHIAGSANDEVRRLADFVIADFQRWSREEALLYSVEPASLAWRA
ncbi:2-hydroxyacid-family dehydrogenase [Lentisphaera araneosa HTCC2155]|uniref:2-hydroxyacid-family dehydrogenase n=1 Tax=Lentisphaera araneosa HTCC2155 TaxID=313628 RepID=A6DPW5_9BACT|nr:hydroxyacid dehydrogenase [Lentisphaera araneosa]EDM26410.1 2-hydroxyacid-family dehydrogenase [Lentisphaera araneosa HTCC2155]